MPKPSLSPVLAEIAFDLGVQTKVHHDWLEALKKGKPSTCESMEAFFDALDQFDISTQDRASLLPHYQQLMGSAKPSQAFVVMGLEIDSKTRQIFIDSIESKLGPLDWTIDTNFQCGAVKTIKPFVPPVVNPPIEKPPEIPEHIKKTYKVYK